MGRTVGGVALLALALFMLYGFFRSSATLSSAAGLVALVIGVVLPAIGGIALLRGRLGGPSRARVDALRRKTLEAETLRLAVAHGGRLTALELSVELALTPEEAKALLDDLAARELAELEITDRGVIVYAFHDARHLGGKQDARPLLDA